MISSLLDLYARSGISLKEIGLNEAALPLEVSLEALRYIKDFGFLVLGGDVYRRTSSRNLELAYMDWFYAGSSSAESIRSASEYLSNISGNDFYIVFVMKTAEN